MKANELRIGNWIEGIKMENPIRIINDSIAYNYYNERFEIDAVDIKYYKPIPLTEEWLLRFGFVKSKANSCLYLNTGYFELIFDEYFYLSIEGQRVNLNVKHVHTLQNLYFALTGTELELRTES